MTHQTHMRLHPSVASIAALLLLLVTVTMMCSAGCSAMTTTSSSSTTTTSSSSAGSAMVTTSRSRRSAPNSAVVVVADTTTTEQVRVSSRSTLFAERLHIALDANDTNASTTTTTTTQQPGATNTTAPPPTPIATTTTTTSAPPSDVVYGNITADYSKGTLGRVQTDLLKAGAVALAFIILAVLDATVPRTTVKELSPSDLMKLDTNLLENDTEDLLENSSFTKPSIHSSHGGVGNGHGVGSSLVVAATPVHEGGHHNNKAASSTTTYVAPTIGPAPTTIAAAAVATSSASVRVELDDPLNLGDDSDDGIEMNAML